MPFRPLCLALFAALGLSAIPAHATPDSPAVKIAQGTLSGLSGEGIESFRGIPYAAPPVGDLRWRAPQPAAGWSGTRDATHFGDDCMQDLAHNHLPAGHDYKASEDCLYLNVWRPAGVRKSAKPLPVMVWIYGGAFIMGSGSMPVYDGSALARQGVIVVTLNYRLARFGVFATPALCAQHPGEACGNYWLMDQIAALQWVKRNIAAFGGDPAKVTIFGESAGAVAVSTLMAVPPAHGLFQRAIAESGSPRRWLPPLAVAEKQDLAWAKSKGVTSDNPAALRALPAETVLDAPVTQVREPMIDGKLITEAPAIAFAQGRSAKVPLLIGANDWEESLLRWMPGIAEAKLKSLGPDADRALALYDVATVGQDKAMTRMWGDAAMVEPARATARLSAAAGNPTYLYRFAYVPEAQRSVRPGVGHSDEIEFVFDTPTDASKPGWTAGDEATAKLTSAYWVAFARTGNPNHAGAPQWPRFTVSDSAQIAFTNTGPKVLKDFEKQRLDFLEAHAASGDPYATQK
ncbi:carboxylesterase/lipase family protein [Novosphingobium sp. 9]|uniref:carboxylesterase/lipase family protein n=1 Tax=Novosphingobium sp. 9 TaxID=2025349 RepID=UPI0021B5F8B4|nr:carboxylesterase/lipase family protein [Novosphingobium sp. 9]